jgi:transposase-like protein
MGKLLSGDRAGLAWADIAGKLGISRQTLYNWRKLPEAPTEPDLDAWIKWMEANKEGGASIDLQEAKRQVELEKLRKLRRENEIQEGRMISVEEATACIRTATQKWDLALTQALDTEGPKRCEGKGVAELRMEFRMIHDELRAVSKRLFSEGLLKS